MPAERAERMPELDGLRALAIIGVLLYHAFASAPLEFLRRATGLGWAGVDLFFVISGFLIGGILMDRKSAVNYYQVFYLRRFFRIVPLYAIVIAPAILVIGLGLQTLFKGHSIAGSGWAVWLYPFFLQNIGYALLLNLPHHLGPAWSLAVEEQFYLVLPPLVRKLQPRTLIRVVVVAIVSAPLLRGLLVWLFAERSNAACYALLPCRWDALLLGVLCAYSIRDRGWRERLLARLAGLRWAWAMLAAGMIGITAMGWSQWDPPVAIPGYTWIALFFSATLLLAHLNPSGLFNRFLRARLLKPVATVSYALYLLQAPVAAVVEAPFRHGGPPPTGWTSVGVNFLALAVTGLAAALSWRFYESRMLRIGHQFRFREAGELPGDTAANQAREPGIVSTQRL